VSPMAGEDTTQIRAVSRAIGREYREILADNARWALVHNSITVEAVDAIPGVGVAASNPLTSQQTTSVPARVHPAPLPALGNPIVREISAPRRAGTHPASCSV
jgi:hypothetical protein